MGLLRKFLLVVFTLAMAGVACAQKAPVAPLAGSNSSDLTLSYMLMVKSKNFDLGYEGADITYTKYLTRHWGFRAEADLERMNKWAYREYGVRGGAAYRFRPTQRVQPHAELLLGYARAKGTIFPGPRVYHSGLSIMGGAGVDYRIRPESPWFVRAGVDIVADTNSTAGYGSKYGRGIVGISYHFGDR